MDATGSKSESVDGTIASFGPFEFRFQTGELRKHGVRVRLQGKPAHLLRSLVEHHGEVVTRDELKHELWPSDVFVDFESGLNTAANRLRFALGDSAEHPVYIETLPKVGYRFVAPVSIVIPPGHAVLSPQTPEKPVSEPVPVSASSKLQPLQAWRNPIILAVALGALLGCGLLIYVNLPGSTPSFQQVTFSRVFTGTARFAPDGKAIVYGSVQRGAGSQIFLVKRGSAESQVLQKGRSWLAGVSPHGELAVFKHSGAEEDSPLVLESIPLQGGKGTVLADHAKEADWSSEGSLCLVLVDSSGYSVNYPRNRTIYRSTGWISNLRISPDGRYVAFLEHPLESDDAGQVVMVDTNTGQAHPLSSGWGSVTGLAWHPAKQEVWFTGARSGINRVLMAVDLKGKVRQVAQIPGGMVLHDVAPNGDVLIARTNARLAMFLGNLENQSNDEISLLDWSRAVALTDDGNLLLFDESGEGGGKQYSVYLYNTLSRASERLGEGRAMDLSVDGRWALTQAVNDSSKLTLISISQKKASPIRTAGMVYQWAKFIPDAECPEIVFGASQPGRAFQIYRQRLPDGKLQLLADNVELRSVVAGNESFVAGVNPEGGISVVDLRTGLVRSLHSNKYGFPVRFMGDHEILTGRYESGLLRLNMVDITTGQGALYRRFEIADNTGNTQVHWLHASKDLSRIAYSQMQTLSDLFTVSGWR